MTFGGFSALLIFLIGLLVGFVGGWWWRGRAPADPAADPAADRRTRPAPAPAGAPERAPEAADPEAADPEAAGRTPAPPLGGGAQARRPPALSAADGDADDLKMISGVGPKLEQTLNGLGIYHFRQIAALKPAEIAWLDAHLTFRGRIEREDWVGQARTLAGQPDR